MPVLARAAHSWFLRCAMASLSPLLACAFLACVAACGGPRSTEAPRVSTAAPPKPAPAAPSIRRIPLQGPAELVAARVTTPAIEVRLGEDGEERAWLLVDSGAAIHTLADVLLPRMRFRTSVAQHAADAGSAEEVRVAHDVPFVLAKGGELRLRAAALAPLPDELMKLHVIGVVSPQLLAEDGEAVLLDLRAPALSIGPAEALVAESGAKPVDAASTRVCADVAGDGKGGHVPVRLYALRAKVGAKDGWLLHDSGVPFSRLRDGAPISEGLASGSGPRIARQVVLGLAGTTRTLDVRIGRTPEGCAEDGLLGADALAGCRTVLAADRLWMRCD